MATKPKTANENMIRMQLLVSQHLKEDVEAFATEHDMSANEAMRILVRRGLAASGKPFTASQLLEEFTHLVRDLEARARQ